jgi:hypothetical protein
MASAPRELDPGSVHFSVDTTQRSFLHSLMRDRQGRPRSRVMAVIAVILLSYVPMLIAVLLTKDRGAPKLTFFQDWNNTFMFLVTLPTLLLLTVTDDRVLSTALARIQIDGILSLSGTEAALVLQSLWEKRFQVLNVVAACIALVTGISVAAANYYTYTRPGIGFWAAPAGRFLPLGYVFLFGIFLFYALLAIYFLRTAAISFLLRDVVRHAQLSMLPAHPDRCGGLRPVGRLGLRNQYALTVCGLNVALLIIVFSHYLNVLSVSAALYGLIAAAAIAYVVLGPIVFLGPLLSFREGMLRTKMDLMSEVAQRLRLELRRLRQQLPSGRIGKEDEEIVDRLRKLGTIIDELPVWPFDAGTLRRFVTAYVMPLIGGLAYLGLKEIVSAIFKRVASGHFGA